MTVTGVTMKKLREDIKMQKNLVCIRQLFICGC